MVSQMLNSIQAPVLAGHEDAWGVLSRMWTLAVQDFTQVGIVMGFVVVGWLLVSMLLRAIGAVAVAPRGKLGPKLVSDVSGEAEAVDECTEPSCAAPRANPGLTLLEHYGVFGTVPGVWATDAPATPAEEEEAAEALVPHKAAALPDATGARTPRGVSLLEQYGVFGASPKCWRNTKVDGFGELLTAIT